VHRLVAFLPWFRRMLTRWPAPPVGGCRISYDQVPAPRQISQSRGGPGAALIIATGVLLVGHDRRGSDKVVAQSGPAMGVADVQVKGFGTSGCHHRPRRDDDQFHEHGQRAAHRELWNFAGGRRRVRQRDADEGLRLERQGRHRRHVCVLLRAPSVYEGDGDRQLTI
jgi:hypothetical protein